MLGLTCVLHVPGIKFGLDISLSTWFDRSNFLIANKAKVEAVGLPDEHQLHTVRQFAKCWCTTHPCPEIFQHVFPKALHSLVWATAEFWVFSTWAFWLVYPSHSGALMVNKA